MPKIDKSVDAKLEKEIQSELKFIWNLIKHILLTPWILILVLFGKKNFKDLIKPFKLIWNFITSAKFTAQIILINILAFVVELFLSEEVILSLANSSSNLINFQFYTLITSGFLHAGISHLLWNMLGIFIFGRIVERKLGYLKTAFIYFGALIISNLFSSIIDLIFIGNNIPGIGASGALMGLVATAILLDPLYITHDLLIPLPCMFVGWIFIIEDLLSAFKGIDDGVGHFAHIGGFLSITLIYFIMNKKSQKHLKKGLKINIISAFIVLLGYLVFKLIF